MTIKRRLPNRRSPLRIIEAVLLWWDCQLAADTSAMCRPHRWRFLTGAATRRTSVPGGEGRSHPPALCVPTGQAAHGIQDMSCVSFAVSSDRPSDSFSSPPRPPLLHGLLVFAVALDAVPLSISVRRTSVVDACTLNRQLTVVSAIGTSPRYAETGTARGRWGNQDGWAIANGTTRTRSGSANRCSKSADAAMQSSASPATTRCRSGVRYGRRRSQQAVRTAGV